MKEEIKTLLIEDDSQIVEKLKPILTDEGCDVETTNDGQEGLDIALTGFVDLVFVSSDAPKVDGLEICRRLKKDEKTRDIPVILMAASANAETKKTALQAGADFILSKPFDEIEVKAKVKTIIKIRRIVDELKAMESVILEIGRIVESRNLNTEGHLEQLAKYVRALGNRMGVSAEELEALDKACVLHDIGMITVPIEILFKNEKLSPQEAEKIREHPFVGEFLLKPVSSFKDVIPIVKYHHEKFDGSGYPEGLKGDNIPLTARIFTTADIFDALTSPRPYRASLSNEEALRVMEEECEWGWIDPKIFEELNKLAKNGFSQD